MTIHERSPMADEAEVVASIIDSTSKGVASYLLEDLVSGFSPQALLAAAMLQGDGAYSLDNILLLEQDNQIAGLLFSYPATLHKVMPLMRSFVPASRIEAVLPILERAVPDSLYINTIWVAENMRGQKTTSTHGQKMSDLLMQKATARAKSLGLSRVSLFCWNDNHRALSFYTRHGFSIAEHFPPEALRLHGCVEGGSLLCKTLALE